MVGDSLARAIGGAMESALLERGIGMKQMTYTGCPPVPDVYVVHVAANHKCFEYNNDVRDILSKSHEGQYVVMLARWALYLEGPWFDNGEGGLEDKRTAPFFVDIVGDDGREIHEDVLERKRLVADRYRKEIRDLLASGRKVIVIYPFPEAGWDVPKQLVKMRMFSGDAAPDLSVSYDTFKSRTRAAIAALDSIGEHQNLYRIRPDALFCNTIVPNRCALTLHGAPLYTDESHPSNLASRMIIAEVMKHIH
jgi:hypothetical protein